MTGEENLMIVHQVHIWMQLQSNWIAQVDMAWSTQQFHIHSLNMFSFLNTTRLQNFANSQNKSILGTNKEYKLFLPGRQIYEASKNDDSSMGQGLIECS